MAEKLPPGVRIATCKYGENAWQTPAYLYSSGTDDPLALGKFRLIEGAPPSYNNWCDIDRLLQTSTHIGAISRDGMRSPSALNTAMPVVPPWVRSRLKFYAI